MGFLWRKRAKPETEPEPQDRAEEDAPPPEVTQDRPVYPLPRDEKGRYVSRKRM